MEGRIDPVKLFLLSRRLSVKVFLSILIPVTFQRVLNSLECFLEPSFGTFNFTYVATLFAAWQYDTITFHSYCFKSRRLE